ncbi:teichoic acid transport system permease protein [Motilibacter rhizosphaerae]|uniref:Teichoic acid transport system permease protein n=1 Tax=Motilibacter rhizosphaerae TaxID=598652 RepID=A0A4V2F4R3_9ACTN|nr:ABC transporter permease [Motilibacter rhizosphaerae]RZS90219.1 teichoic acid transport system permease protein [Motilibacter rhizosphaerae]
MAQVAEPRVETSAEVHVYEPHKVGVPPQRKYLRDLWKRREFAVEYARSELHTQNVDTVLGQVWLVLNPLLLGSVYFILVNVLSTRTVTKTVVVDGHRVVEHVHQGQGPTYFAHLLAGLFAYYFVTGAMNQGTKSVTKAGKLLINTAFPRVLLPLASTLVAFWRFLPTLLVYAVVHVIAGRPIGPHLLLALVSVVQMTLLGAGLALFFSTLQVFVRDTSAFLPYATRIWLYLSPVLLQVSHFPGWTHPINPLFWIMACWSELLVQGTVEPLTWWVGGTLWAVGAFLVGWFFFVSREREFAFRL